MQYNLGIPRVSRGVTKSSNIRSTSSERSLKTVNEVVTRAYTTQENLSRIPEEVIRLNPKATEMYSKYKLPSSAGYVSTSTTTHVKQEVVFPERVKAKSINTTGRIELTSLEDITFTNNDQYLEFELVPVDDTDIETVKYCEEHNAYIRKLAREKAELSRAQLINMAMDRYNADKADKENRELARQRFWVDMQQKHRKLQRAPVFEPNFVKHSTTNQFSMLFQSNKRDILVKQALLALEKYIYEDKRIQPVQRDVLKGITYHDVLTPEQAEHFLFEFERYTKGEVHVMNEQTAPLVDIQGKRGVLLKPNIYPVPPKFFISPAILRDVMLPEFYSLYLKHLQHKQEDQQFRKSHVFHHAKTVLSRIMILGAIIGAVSYGLIEAEKEGRNDVETIQALQAGKIPEYIETIIEQIEQEQQDDSELLDELGPVLALVELSEYEKEQNLSWWSWFMGMFFTTDLADVASPTEEEVLEEDRMTRTDIFDKQEQDATLVRLTELFKTVPRNQMLQERFKEHESKEKQEELDELEQPSCVSLLFDARKDDFLDPASGKFVGNKVEEDETLDEEATLEKKPGISKDLHGLQDILKSIFYFVLDVEIPTKDEKERTVRFTREEVDGKIQEGLEELSQAQERYKLQLLEKEQLQAQYGADAVKQKEAERQHTLRQYRKLLIGRLQEEGLIDITKASEGSVSINDDMSYDTDNDHVTKRKVALIIHECLFKVHGREFMEKYYHTSEKAQPDYVSDPTAEIMRVLKDEFDEIKIIEKLTFDTASDDNAQNAFSSSNKKLAYMSYGVKPADMIDEDIHSGDSTMYNESLWDKVDTLLGEGDGSVVGGVYDTVPDAILQSQQEAEYKSPVPERTIWDKLWLLVPKVPQLQHQIDPEQEEQRALMMQAVNQFHDQEAEEEEEVSSFNKNAGNALEEEEMVGVSFSDISDLQLLNSIDVVRLYPSQVAPTLGDRQGYYRTTKGELVIVELPPLGASVNLPKVRKIDIDKLGNYISYETARRQVASERLENMQKTKPFATVDEEQEYRGVLNTVSERIYHFFQKDTKAENDVLDTTNIDTNTTTNNGNAFQVKVTPIDEPKTSDLVKKTHSSSNSTSNTRNTIPDVASIAEEKAVKTIEEQKQLHDVENKKQQLLFLESIMTLENEQAQDNTFGLPSDQLEVIDSLAKDNIPYTKDVTMDIVRGKYSKPRTENTDNNVNTMIEVSDLGLDFDLLESGDLDGAVQAQVAVLDEKYTSSNNTSNDTPLVPKEPSLMDAVEQPSRLQRFGRYLWNVIPSTRQKYHTWRLQRQERGKRAQRAAIIKELKEMGVDVNVLKNWDVIQDENGNIVITDDAEKFMLSCLAAQNGNVDLMSELGEKVITIASKDNVNSVPPRSIHRVKASDAEKLVLQKVDKKDIQAAYEALAGNTGVEEVEQINVEERLAEVSIDAQAYSTLLLLRKVIHDLDEQGAAVVNDEGLRVAVDLSNRRFIVDTRENSHTDEKVALDEKKNMKNSKGQNNTSTNATIIPSNIPKGLYHPTQLHSLEDVEKSFYTLLHGKQAPTEQELKEYLMTVPLDRVIAVLSEKGVVKQVRDQAQTDMQNAFQSVFMQALIKQQADLLAEAKNIHTAAECKGSLHSHAPQVNTSVVPAMINLDDETYANGILDLIHDPKFTPEVLLTSSVFGQLKLVDANTMEISARPLVFSMDNRSTASIEKRLARSYTKALNQGVYHHGRAMFDDRTGRQLTYGEWAKLVEQDKVKEDAFVKQYQTERSVTIPYSHSYKHYPYVNETLPAPLPDAGDCSVMAVADRMWKQATKRHTHPWIQEGKERLLLPTLFQELHTGKVILRPGACPILWRTIGTCGGIRMPLFLDTSRLNLHYIADELQNWMEQLETYDQTNPKLIALYSNARANLVKSPMPQALVRKIERVFVHNQIYDMCSMIAPQIGMDVEQLITNAEELGIQIPGFDALLDARNEDVRIAVERERKLHGEAAANRFMQEHNIILEEEEGSESEEYDVDADSEADIVDKEVFKSIKDQLTDTIQITSAPYEYMLQSFAQSKEEVVPFWQRDSFLDLMDYYKEEIPQKVLNAANYTAYQAKKKVNKAREYVCTNMPSVASLFGVTMPPQVKVKPVKAKPTAGSAPNMTVEKFANIVKAGMEKKKNRKDRILEQQQEQSQAAQRKSAVVSSLGVVDEQDEDISSKHGDITDASEAETDTEYIVKKPSKKKNVKKGGKKAKKAASHDIVEMTNPLFTFKSPEFRHLKMYMVDGEFLTVSPHLYRDPVKLKKPKKLEDLDYEIDRETGLPRINMHLLRTTITKITGVPEEELVERQKQGENIQHSISQLLTGMGRFEWKLESWGIGIETPLEKCITQYVIDQQTPQDEGHHEEYTPNRRLDEMNEILDEWDNQGLDYMWYNCIDSILGVPRPVIPADFEMMHEDHCNRFDYDTGMKIHRSPQEDNEDMDFNLNGSLYKPTTAGSPTGNYTPLSTFTTPHLGRSMVRGHSPGGLATPLDLDSSFAAEHPPTPQNYYRDSIVTNENSVEEDSLFTLSSSQHKGSLKNLRN